MKKSETAGDWDFSSDPYKEFAETLKSPLPDEYVRTYFRDLRDNISGFRAYFWVQGILFAVSVLIQMIMLAYLTDLSGGAGVASMPILVCIIFSTGMFVWLFVLCAQFASLQMRRIGDEMQNTSRFQLETVQMSSKIFEAAERRAGDSVVINGANSVFNFKGKMGDVNQTVQVAGSEGVVSALALLVEYCRGLQNDEATLAAEHLARAAAENPVDKAKIFGIWTRIVALVPTVASVVKIAEGIKALF